MNKKTIQSGAGKKKRPISFPIVAIGASAGGIEAITELLKNLPPSTGMAYVYIQHLDPSHKSMLVPILARATKMKVKEAEEKMIIEENTFYIIPPDKDLAVTDGMLTLNPRIETGAMHMPVDQFFISLSQNHDSPIGIVLSGNASDGTAGLKAIKSTGGFTFAQDDSARFRSMPKSAIIEGVVDMVLSPAQMAAELEALSTQSSLITLMQDGSEHAISDNDEDLKGILHLLKKSTGVDFGHYKMKTIKRRILRRMLLYKIRTLQEYAQYLREHATEINTLYQDFLINVTSFFRDPDAMEYLKKSLLPGILNSKQLNEPVRIWVPACSSGEEAYSLAMVIMEILDDRSSATSIQIFATDLSETAIARARLGLYSKHQLAEVSPKRLQRFFSKVDGSYRIIKPIRDICVFAPHNVFKDPPFSRLDFISCCNLMIYLDVVLQKKILATFHYALNPNGYLMLGKSETVGAATPLFTQVEKKYKIYARKKDGVSRAMFDMQFRSPETKRSERSVTRNLPHKGTDNSQSLERMVDDVLLASYIPACVVVNQDLEILQFRGSAGSFLEPSPGKASLNLLKMAKQGLAFELRSAVIKSVKSGMPVKKQGLEMKHNGYIKSVSIEVAPLKQDGEERLFLVIFQQENEYLLPDKKSAFSKDKMVKQLQEELNTVKDDMRAIIEEQEASNEELQSANEEIVSGNEELQSINEELETSKEELESSNEELMTINTELQVRNEQLAEAYDYAEAVFTTLREGVLVLDQDLRVRSANRSFYRIFRVNENDVEGMLVYELGNRQWDIPRLRQLLEEVIPNNTEFQGFEVTHVFPHIGKKIMLLNAKRVLQKIHRQQLILLAIEDITEHRDAEQTAKDQKKVLDDLVNNLPVMLWMAGTDRQLSFVNRAWLKFTGRTEEQERGDGWMEGIHKDDLENWRSVYHRSFDERKFFTAQYRFRYHDGNYRLVRNSGTPTFSDDGTFTGYSGSCIEIT